MACAHPSQPTFPQSGTIRHRSIFHQEHHPSAAAAVAESNTVNDVNRCKKKHFLVHLVTSSLCVLRTAGKRFEG